LTLFCSTEEAASARGLGDVLLAVDTAVDGERLGAFELVVKSPGISPYGEHARAAASAGTRFIGGSALWFDEHPSARTICVTGTKGKSTSTALIAHLLRAAGHRTALAGNIGLPLLEVLDPKPEPAYWAIELSSYQTLDVAAADSGPEVSVVLNLFPEHLDWHGSVARYFEDKLALVTRARPRVAVLNAADAQLSGLVLPGSEVHWFNRADGWHLRGDSLYRAGECVLDTTRVPLPGRHNRGNLCAVMAAIEAAGLDAASMAQSACSFVPLPNRLQTLGIRDGITYVNDSISTTPHASLAALDCFGQRRVAILVGGHDRGVDWSDFAARMAHDAPAALVTMGANGPRIRALLEPLAREGGFALASAVDLPAAMAKARALLGGEGVLLLSPGAPSFGQYTDYQERGRHFAQLAGFDAQAVQAIPGLGIA
jgi:UDP-N-acetylmuramoylalanine--D-glutamate ligase